ncbi:sulfatase [Wenyingzhuangia sp. 2_MG-2023]|uniref:sulfatase family protein n=1 Tax=Wenyingzhuangia sp. 2_MG-2023 TaxID=3062639 RepID=UPI0026E4505C|nr:sulfatase [Wenyingzhuangia sp. 2_MG-2023]MDO6738807.1 sulfatase [Wenyingzhuangia sp. 2_MG-2023]MDO6802341.1 sulfatase [Wenyingzhuangia sp. 1_MG-2023]
MNPIKNTSLAFLSLISILSYAQIKPKTVEKKKPNVLIIFPDQLRRYSAGFWAEEPYKSLAYGKSDPVITPNIDKLAKNGVVFTNAISNYPLCSPYRGMLMSGVYPEQNGIWNNCKVGRKHSLKDDIPTIPSLFLEAGYNTAYIGKCHWLKNEPLFDEKGNYKGTKKAPGGHHVNQYDTYIPSDKRHGIEYFYQALKDEHFNPHIYSNDPSVIEGKTDGELHLPKIFSPKNEANIIINYLKNKGNHRDTSKPFCMIWSMNPPHNPWDDKNTDMEVLRENYDTDKFPKVDNHLVVRKNVDKKVAKYARHYYANVTSSDHYIGLVLDELKKSGELDNTIVIFSSDHGEMLGSHSKTGKNTVELESLAIPFIVHWPKGLKPGTEELILSVPDILPTTMGLVGIENQIPKSIEGTNYAPILKNEKTQIKKPKAALIMLGNSRGVQTERYTFCVQENKKQWDTDKGDTIKKVFFYDNLKDPYQLKQITLKEAPEVSKQLLATLAQLLKKTNDPWFQTKKHRHLIPYIN